jgi:hypothetical protein
VKPLAGRLTIVSGAICVLAVIVGILVLQDTSEDRGHSLMVNGPVHVYKTEFPPSSERERSDYVALLAPGDQVEVRRVRYGKGYMAVKIRMRDGREGWVFSGESIELK